MMPSSHESIRYQEIIRSGKVYDYSFQLYSRFYVFEWFSPSFPRFFKFFCLEKIGISRMLKILFKTNGKIEEVPSFFFLAFLTFCPSGVNLIILLHSCWGAASNRRAVLPLHLFNFLTCCAKFFGSLPSCSERSSLISRRLWKMFNHLFFPIKFCFYHPLVHIHHAHFSSTLVKPLCHLSHFLYLTFVIIVVRFFTHYKQWARPDLVAMQLATRSK